MESGMGLDGMGMARMSCRRPSFKSSLSFMMSHSYVSEIKPDTKRDVSIAL